MKNLLVKAIVVSILVLLIFPVSQIMTKKRVIIIENSSPDNPLTNNVLNPPAESKRINALFLGMAGEGNSAPNLTDSLMVMSVDEKTTEGFLLSIPRDLLVKIPGKNIYPQHQNSGVGVYTKINAIYQERGLDSVKTILNEITGLNFDYDFVIDLEGVKKIIDQVGGIDVLVESDVYDPAFPGPNNSYQTFFLKKGLQHLDGETALKYARTRYDSTGDFARIARQQKVLIALKDKISSLHPLWNLAIIFDIWETLKGHFQTNLSITNVHSFWKMVKDFNLEKIKFKTLEPTTGLLIPDHALLNNETAYVLKPKAGLDNYSEIKNYINQLLINNNL